MRKNILFIALSLFTSALFAQKLALVKLAGKPMYINLEGKVVIEPPYAVTKNFSDGLAAFQENKKWGFIDKEGKVAIPAQFDNIKYFNSGICVVLQNKRWFYIDKTGKEILQNVQTQKTFDFEDGLAFVRVNNLVGVINTKGETVIEPQYDLIHSFVGGFARAKKAGKWGIIDTKGKVIVDFIYDDLGDYYHQVCWAKLGTAIGLVIDNQFKPLEGVEKIWDFAFSDVTYARKGKLIGFINTKGEWIIQPKYEKARAFVGNMAPVYENKLWGYINRSGEWVVAPKYSDAEIFSVDGLAPAKLGAWGFINEKGDMMVPTIYGISTAFFMFKDEQKGFIDNVARVKYEGKWGFIDKKGKVLGQWYDNAEPFCD